jgi:hypothetical protein
LVQKIECLKSISLMWLITCPEKQESVHHKFVMMQYNFKQSLKHYGEKRAIEILEKGRQHHKIEALSPQSICATKEQSGALQYLMYLKQKQCSHIKKQKCTN